MTMQTVSLGDICRPKQWKTLSKKEMLGEGYVVYGANGPIGLTDRYTHEHETILVGCRGSCGALHKMPPRSYANGNAMALGELHDDMNLQFLFRFLEFRGFSDIITGTSQPQIIRSNIEGIKVPLPPLSEQKRIAGILDEAARLCRLRASALEKLNTLGQAIFRTESERASETAKITDLAQINPRRRFETDEDFPVCFLPMAAVSENGDITDPEERQLNDVRKGFTYFEDGDVLVAKITPCFENGKGCLVSGLAHEVGFGSTEFHVLRTSDPLMREWLHLATRSDAFRHAGERSMTGSAGQKRVPAGFISDFEVRLPTADRLEKINEALNTIGKRRQEIARAAVAGNQLFASLQHRAFRGEL